MNRAKIIFSQTLMISTTILFGLGIRAALKYIIGGEAYKKVDWYWFTPLAVVLTGFFCAVPTLFLLEEEGRSRKKTGWRILFHFLSIFGVVNLCAGLFKWYETVTEYMVLTLMFVLIYGFVWIAEIWISKSDEKKINEAIKNIRDKE